MKEITFKVENVEYKIRKPTTEEFRQAEKVFNKSFHDSVSSGLPLKARARDILKEQKLWDDDKQKLLEDLQRQLVQKEYVLHLGGIKKSDARALAIQIRQLRKDANEVLIPLTMFNQHTAEGKAENAKFNYLVSVCVVYNDGKQYFNSLDDYLNRDNDKVADIASNKFAELYYDIAEDYQSTLPENKVLKQLGFADDKYRLIDKKGRLVNEEGKLIDENGRLVDESGNYIDIFGHKLTKDGDFAIESKPFIDDEAESAVG